jgi:hypothetical protein
MGPPRPPVAAAVAGEAPVALGAGSNLEQLAALATKGKDAANAATLGFDPRAVSTAAKAAAKAAGPAAAAEMGWGAAMDQGGKAVAKKVVGSLFGKGNMLGKGLSGVALMMLVQSLANMLFEHGVMMPGGQGMGDLQYKAKEQEALSQINLQKAQMPSESALLAQAMLGPMQQQAGQAQQAALQSGAQMSDMGWM